MSTMIQPSARSAGLLVELPELAPFGTENPWGTQAREFLEATKDRLYVEHQKGASGTAVVETYTEAMDHLLRCLFDAANAMYEERFNQLEQRCALVAQGGYGRGELNPWSDIDLLFLCERSRGAFLENMAERIMYTLYDTRLQVGNAMRTTKECVTLAATDLKVKTALLDARFLCGDRELYDGFAEAMDTDVLNKNAPKFFAEKIEENHERHARYGDSVFLLEPEIKEGEGGLRDLHTAMWMAKVKFKTNKLDALVEQGVINERERDEVRMARDFLWKVRNAIHFLTKQHQDRLRFEFQDHVAEELGFETDENSRAVEKFMRQYYLCAASVHHFGEQIMERCRPKESQGPVSRLIRTIRRREIRPGVVVSPKTISIQSASLLKEDPTNFIRLFTEARRNNVEISNVTKRKIRQNLDLIDDEQRASKAMSDALFEVLRLKTGVYDTLLAMHQAGVLGAYMPEFGNLLCMVVRDLSHTYTVDQHSLRTVHELEQLLAGHYKDRAPLLTSVVKDVDRIDLCYLSLLLHDIGKGHGSEHSARGARQVPEIAARMHLNEDEAQMVHFLVADHLEMSKIARTRDIHDENIIVEFAKHVGSAENLKALYVLTFSDMRGVAPKVWNNWHDMLLGELYARSLDIFEKGAFVVEGHVDRVRRVKKRVYDASTEEHRGRVEAFLADMPDRYFLGTAEDSIREHISLVARLHEEPLVAEVRHEPEREFSELTVLTADRPGLFAKISGVLLVNGMDVLGASINTSLSGMVIDIFRIPHGDDAEVAMRPQRWNRLRKTLREVVVEGADVEALVAGTDLSKRERKWRPVVPTVVEINNDVSEHFTVVDVNSTDIAGAMFQIANVLFHQELRIYLAKVGTNVDHIQDVFYVTDVAGRKVTDAEKLEQIQSELCTRLDALSGHQRTT